MKKTFLASYENKAHKVSELYVGNSSNKALNVRALLVGDSNNKAVVLYATVVNLTISTLGHALDYQSSVCIFDDDGNEIDRIYFSSGDTISVPYGANIAIYSPGSHKITTDETTGLRNDNFIRLLAIGDTTPDPSVIFNPTSDMVLSYTSFLSVFKTEIALSYDKTKVTDITIYDNDTTMTEASGTRDENGLYNTVWMQVGHSKIAYCTMSDADRYGTIQEKELNPTANNETLSITFSRIASLITAVIASSIARTMSVTVRDLDSNIDNDLSESNTTSYSKFIPIGYSVTALGSEMTNLRYAGSGEGCTVDQSDHILRASAYRYRSLIELGIDTSSVKSATISSKYSHSSTSSYITTLNHEHVSHQWYEVIDRVVSISLEAIDENYVGKDVGFIVTAEDYQDLSLSCSKRWWLTVTLGATCESITVVKGYLDSSNRIWQYEGDYITITCNPINDYYNGNQVVITELTTEYVATCSRKTRRLDVKNTSGISIISNTLITDTNGKEYAHKYSDDFSIDKVPTGYKYKIDATSWNQDYHVRFNVNDSIYDDPASGTIYTNTTIDHVADRKYRVWFAVMGDNGWEDNVSISVTIKTKVSSSSSLDSVDRTPSIIIPGGTYGNYTTSSTKYSRVGATFYNKVSIYVNSVTINGRTYTASSTLNQADLSGAQYGNDVLIRIDLELDNSFTPFTSKAHRITYTGN